MAKKKASDPVPEERVFSLEDIDRGIAKLTRRADELRALQGSSVLRDDPRVEQLKIAIRDAIRDVFGPTSPEFIRNQYFAIWHGSIGIGMHPAEIQARFQAGIPHAIAILDGLILRLEEKRQDLAGNPTKQRVPSFDSLQLHKRIADAAGDLFRDGHYSNAVFDASKTLVNFVKEKSGRHDLDGAPLMQQVFSPNNPIVAFSDLKDQSEKDEQQGLMHLFTGAVLALRNPRGHDFPQDSAETALEYLGLLSLLSNRLERARRKPPVTPPAPPK